MPEPASRFATITQVESAATDSPLMNEHFARNELGKARRMGRENAIYVAYLGID